jgi:hypothetical protein
MFYPKELSDNIESSSKMKALEQILANKKVIENKSNTKRIG